MHVSLGSRLRRTLLHHARTPSRVRQSPIRVDVSPSAQGAGDAADVSGDAGGLVTGSSEGGSEGGSELGAEEDGAVDVVCGQGVAPWSAPGEEAQADGDDEEDAEDGAVGVDTLTDGEGFAGGCVLLSWRPESPRCRAIQVPWSAS